MPNKIGSVSEDVQVGLNRMVVEIVIVGKTRDTNLRVRDDDIFGKISRKCKKGSYCKGVCYNNIRKKTLL